MVKNTQAIRYLNVFNHFVGLALNVLKLERKFSSERVYIHCVVLIKVKKLTDCNILMADTLVGYSATPAKGATTGNTSFG